MKWGDAMKKQIQDKVDVIYNMGRDGAGKREDDVSVIMLR